MILDYIRFAFANFKARKIRSVLTMIGIFIGIAAVVSLVALGQGLQKSISGQFEAMGIDKVFIQPQGNFGLSGRELTIRDSDEILRVRGVKAVAGFIYKIVRTEYHGNSKWSTVVGSPQDEGKAIISDMKNFKIAKGRDLNSRDNNRVLIGKLVHEGDVFGKEVDIGDEIEIHGRSFKVVGVLGEFGNPGDDSSFYIPLSTARDLLDVPDTFNMLFAQVDSAENVVVIADEIEKKLRKLHNVKEGEEDFTVETSEELLDSYGSILNVVNAVVIGIACISLLVGGVGITNTMYTSVLERTREIGIMKAIGARNSDILLIFLLESGILGLAGGIIGILLGVGFAKLVYLAALQGNITYFEPYFPAWLMIGTLLFAYIVGTVSGIMPARQASKLQPVEALRYE